MAKDLRGYVAMSEERRAAFLVALRRSGGNFSAASAAASPHSKASPRSKPGFSSFRALMDRDPTFAAEVQVVLGQVRDDVYAIIWRLATEGTKDNIYQRGEQIFNRDGSVAQVQKWDSKLLLRLAAKLDPDWNESKDIQHTVASEGAATHFAPTDLRYLSDGQRDNLRSILRTIRDAQDGQLALTHQPVETVDFIEVDAAEEAFPL